MVAAFLLAVVLGLAAWTGMGRQVFNYPFVRMETPEGLRVDFLLKSSPNPLDCRRVAAGIARSTQANCFACKVTQASCLGALDADLRLMMTDRAVGYPSAKYANGVIAYHATKEGLADAVCSEAARLSVDHAVNCYPAGVGRPEVMADKMPSLGEWAALLAGAIAAFAAAWATCWLVIRYDHLHAHMSSDTLNSGPQKFHAVPTPRIGGLALVAGLLGAGAALIVFRPKFGGAEFAYLLICAVPAFFGGIADDVTKRIGPALRLSLTFLSGALACVLVGALLDRIDVPYVDELYGFIPIAVLFTAFSVAGVTNSLNIIDGYNGLAAGYALLVLGAIAGVAAYLGDSVVLEFALALFGAIGGFLVWNFPRGRIFLGDGGAYLAGFLLAELSVLLVVRNQVVSPWFPLLLLCYPITETIFSIYRKKVIRNLSPGRPDGLHFHMLIYKRLVRCHTGTRDPVAQTMRNSMVAPYVWAMNVFPVAYACAFWSSTGMLMVGVAAFAIAYWFAYHRIVSWRAPQFLIKR